MSLAEIKTAISRPNETIATGFEDGTLVLVDGRLISGNITVEEDHYLYSSADKNESFTKVEVEVYSPAISGMPEGLLEDLGKHEIDDLHYFLVNLKGE
ncbi:hypothetical protein Pan189_03710 [Stratiformator vulcanicus]|uniref:Uncharacterized protein n=2 Tax=Stratiformator vulcanicus TaxID=2527980 RepID=A0A517QWH6_9PLAN|nr:hypothetical protein Pan189_03710 [Stratiformator vulcanicus]